MTKTLYLIWHGKTLFARQGKCEGWSDSPLVDDAFDRARAAGTSFFAARGIKPATFVTSISERACDTLELVCQAAFGQVGTYDRLKGLKDLNCGQYEAQDACLAPSAPYGDFFAPYGGETADETAERVRATLVDLAARAEGPILVSTHRLACSLVCGLWDDELAARVLVAPDCSVLTLAFDEDSQALTFVDLFENEA